MERTKRILVVLSILVFVLSACGAQPTQAQPTSASTQVIEPVFTPVSGDLPQTEAEVTRVTVQSAKVAFEGNAAIFVDVRSPGDFEASHIAGAISVPLGQIERELTEVPLDKDQWIITYCT